MTEPLVDKLPEDLTAEQRQYVTDLLQEYDGIFSKGQYDMGCTTLMEQSIDASDSRPIRQGLHHHPMANLDIIVNQVDEMVRHNLVEPSASP